MLTLSRGSYRLFKIRIAFITTPRPAANRLAAGLGVVIKANLIMGRPIALGSTIAHAYNKLRSVKVEIPQNNFVVSVKAVPQVLSSCACTFQHFYVS